MADGGDGLLKVGGKFGDYDVIKLLGRGGMGEVYLLRSPADGEFYAAKIMFPPKGGNAHEMRRRFANEATIAMKVLHKNLIRVYDVGEDPETHLCYILMEYLGGGSLADRIRKSGSLPVRDAVGITMEVALALEASHRAGIIHRDIKPDNILFSDDGTPKLVDLGIAKLDDGSSTTMTMTGVIIGTPAYMAPEQMMDSHNVDARADVYSLGVVLYEMLSGTRPNSGSTAMELLAKAVRGEELPDVRTLRPEVSATLGYVLSRMTAVKAENRIASAIEAAKMLRDAFTGELRPPLASKRPHLIKTTKSILPAIGIAAASVAFAALLFFAIRGMRQPAAAPQFVTNVVSRVVYTNAVADARAEAAEEVRKDDAPVDGTDAVVSGPDADGLYSAHVGRYKWFFKKNGDRATLEKHKNGDSNLPCIEPWPVGRLVIPANIGGCCVAGIGDEAFAYCGDMTEAVLPDGLETVGRSAFLWSGLTTLSLPPSLREVGAFAFAARPLETLDIGSCCNLGQLCFSGCGNLRKVAVARDNPSFIVDGLSIYSRDGKELVKYLDYKSPTFRLRRGVERLLTYSIADVKLDKEETVKVPEGVTDIRDVAFWGQDKVQTLVLPKSVKRIGHWIAYNCPRLKTIRFLGDAPEAAVKALQGASNELVVEVMRGSKGWNGPGSTDLPERWPVNAGDLACPIRYVGETEAEASARLGKLDAALPMSDGNATVLFPRLDRDSNAWAYSFSEEKGWTERDFDDSRWNRAQGGFGKRDVQTQLRHARINTEWKSGRIFLRRHFNWSGGDVSRAVVDLFHDDDVVLYLNGTRIQQAAGADFDWLPREIPVEQFAAALRTGDNVFCAEVVNKWHCAYFDCGLLVECGGEVERPGSASDGVRKVKTAAGTWTVKVANGAAQIGDGQGPALSPLPSGHLEIPSVLDGLKIKRLAARSFRDCKNLKSVKIKEGVRAIDYQAFCNCNALESLDIPETLEWIGGEALSSTALKSLDIKNVRVIDGGVFRDCKRLNEMKANPGNLTYFLKDGVLYDRVTRRLVFAPRSLTEIKFPRGIEGIYECAFQHGQIKSVVFPETVNYVGHSAFNECTMLESVEFKCEDARIDGWAFGRSPKLAKVVLPSRLTKLDDWSIFEDDGQLESVELPDTVEVLGDSVFKKCRKLRKVTLGKSLKTIRHRAFNGCSRLESVTLPPTVEELGDGVFSYCPALKTVRFKGNCPKTGNDLYKESHPFLNTVVDKEAQGWAKVVNQRGRWPLDAGGDSRTVRYATKSELAAEDKAESARPKTSAGTREVPVGSVPIEFRVDVEKLRKRYKGRNGGKGDGRIVLGRLNVEDGTAEDVATWAWLNKDGTFTAAAIMAARNGIVFMKNGYEPLTVQVAEARQQWRDDVAVDLGTVTLRKLADDRTAAFSVTPVLPDGVDGGRLTLTLENRNPCGNDWGTVGREHPNCVVKRVDFRRGEKVTVPGCAPASHAFTIEAQGCPVYSGKINLSSGGNDAGERRLFRTKTAVFAIRPCDERGGQWVRRSVAIDGNNALLLKEGGDGYNNKCRFFFNAYTDSPKDVASHFGWGPNEYRDLGEMTVEELERREKAGESPADGAVKCGSRLTAGHIYRFAERYHWKIDLLVAFESYGDGSDEPVPDGNGIYTTHVNGYDWKYRLDGDGNATLCGPNETTPCVSPKPTGELVVPDAIHGHKVTTISPLAFRFCDKMTRIVLPAHLENLTWFCAGNIFSSCHALASIEISDSNARCASEGGALYTKDKKTLLAYPKSRDRVTLAKETTDIGSDAFSSCTFKTVELPEGIERVQSWAFCVCPNLEEVEFPKSLKSVGCTLFHTSPSLRSVVFRGDAPSVEDGGGESLFSRAPGFLTVKVERGSKGWNGPGTAGLPDRWPLGSVGGSRPIAYKQYDKVD